MFNRGFRTYKAVSKETRSMLKIGSLLSQGDLVEKQRYTRVDYTSEFALSNAEFDILEKHAEKIMASDLRKYGGEIAGEDFAIGCDYAAYWYAHYPKLTPRDRVKSICKPNVFENFPQWQDYKLDKGSGNHWAPGEGWAVEYLHPSYPKIRSLSTILKHGDPLVITKELFSVYFVLHMRKRIEGVLNKDEEKLLLDFVKARNNPILVKDGQPKIRGVERFDDLGPNPIYIFV